MLPLRTLTRRGERLPAPAHFPASAGCPQIRSVELYPGQNSRGLAPARSEALLPDAEVTIHTLHSHLF